MRAQRSPDAPASMRRRAAVGLAALGLALTGAVVPTGGNGAAAAPAAAQQQGSDVGRIVDRIDAKQQRIKKLRAKVRRADDRLAARTAEWERSRDAVRAATTQHEAVEAAAAAARAVAEQARLDLGRFAAAAYRGAQLPTEITLLVAPSDTVQDTLHGLQTLEHSGQVKTDIATFAADAATRADELTAQARELRDTRAVAAYRLDVARGELEATMAQTRRRLRAQVARLGELEEEKFSAGCLEKADLAASFPNGMIPAGALCPIGIGAHLVRGDAAVAFKPLAEAYRKKFDAEVCVTSSYRSRKLQAQLFEDDPIMVAAPGRSRHGAGLALDLCGGIEQFGSDQHEWMKRHAPRFGWFHPAWAAPDGVTPEPWHWEFEPELLAAMQQAEQDEQAKRDQRSDGRERSASQR